MKGIKIILVVTFFLFTLNSYSQSVKRYESDYAIKVTIDKNESPDGGTVEDIMQANTSIVYDTSRSTIEIKLSDHNRRIYFFKNVKYSETFTNNGNKYVAYTAYEDGVPHFISFSNELIKVDNRVKYKSITFHIKK